MILPGKSRNAGSPGTRLFPLVLIPWVLLASCVGGKTAQSADIALELGDFFAARETEGFSGVVSLTQGDKILLRRAYGVAGCDGDDLTLDHVFLIGSIVKVFTKAAVYQLAGEKKLNLGDSIATYLSNVPKDKRAITIDMLSSHSSGLDDTIGEEGQPVAYSIDWDYLPVSKQQIIERGMKSMLVFAPKTDRQYSNLAYSLLAAVIEAASGKSYENYVRDAVLEPSGMMSTGYVLPNWANKPMADGCVDGTEWKSPHTAGRWMDDGPSWNLRGNGGMLGTLGDLEAWIDALKRADVMPAETMSAYLADTIGQSRTFKQSATVAAGGNGIVNSYYLWLVDDDIRLVMISNSAEHQVESYLDVIFPMLSSLSTHSSPASE